MTSMMNVFRRQYLWDGQPLRGHRIRPGLHTIQPVGRIRLRYDGIIALSAPPTHWSPSARTRPTGPGLLSCLAWFILLMVNALRRHAPSLQLVEAFSRGRNMSLRRELLPHGLKPILLTLPIIIAGNVARGSEGYVAVIYSTDTCMGSSCAVVHLPKNLGLASEGIDQYDSIYSPMFDPSGIATKVVSMVEGIELTQDERPEESKSGATFNYRVISDGRSIPPILNPRLVVSTSRLFKDNATITVEGIDYDAKTVGTIPLTSTTGTGTIFFSDINEPNDPNNPPVQYVNVNKLTASKIGKNSATLEAFVDQDLGEPVSSRWIYQRSGDPNSTVVTAWECCTSAGQTITKEISGLVFGKQYDFSVEVENSKGTDAETGSFRTKTNEGRLTVNYTFQPIWDTSVTMQDSLQINRLDEPNASDCLDSLDKLDVAPVTSFSWEPQVSSILIDGPNTIRLSEDHREFLDSNSPSPVELNLRIVRRGIPWSTVPSPGLRQELSFALDPEYNYGDSPIIFQQTSPEIPNGYAPNDLRALRRYSIDGITRIPLSDIVGVRVRNANPYEIGNAEIRFAGSVADINRDGRVDPNDGEVVINSLGRSGMADIASLQPDPNNPSDPDHKIMVLGIPDGIVDRVDIDVIKAEIAKEELKQK